MGIGERAAARSLPQLLWSRSYERAWLRWDVLAGLTVAAMLVPQAMAYAELGDLPPSAGFRAALMALPVYALLGTSRHLGAGPEPGTIVLAAATAAALSNGDPDRFAALMAATGVLVGVVALLAGLLRLGFVAELLSKPVLVGYITGVGLTLLTSQFQTFTGVSIDADNPFVRVGELLGRLDQVDATTLFIGSGTLAVILGLKRFAPSWPGALIGLGTAMLAVALFDLDVATVGEIDAALPSFEVPGIEWADVADLIGPAAGVALIGYTDNILTARSIASRHRYEVDANRELVALGAMNVAGGFAGGFPMSSSASRSFVPSSIGSRSQLSSVVTLVAVVVLLVVGQSLLADIPRAGLAAVIVAAAFAVIDVDGFRGILRVSRIEAVLAVVTCLAVLSVDLLFGVIFAVVLSLLILVARVARPSDAILGRGEGLAGWVDVDDERAHHLDGLLVYRFDAPLFFANAEHFRERVQWAMDLNPGVESTIILDLEGVGSVDSTAVDHLHELVDELERAELHVGIARANPQVIEVLERAGLLGPGSVVANHPTINAAVAAFEEQARGEADD
ncbi:MAG: SulP family inorganic anion transporter [Actinomycetota bacterium]